MVEEKVGLVFLYVLLSLTLKWTASLEVTLIHTNDVHSRFRQVNAKGGFCSEVDEAKQNCYGGVARLYHKAEEIRRSHPNVVYLSGGDYFQGTVWYTLYKWEVVTHFVNKLNHTAMALGNHEFDDGVAGLLPFLNNVTFPILSANIDVSKEPELEGKFKKSIVVEREGQKIGIIGYTTEETMFISNPGKNLFFGNVTAAVEAEAKRLYEKEGIRIIMAVGHAGYEVDLEVARVPYVDVVVGGHTNTFLYKGMPPDREIPEDEYPRLVKKEDGTEVPVVQAFAYGKYLGLLNLTFDTQGILTHWSGNPILLNSKIPQDPDILVDIEEWDAKVNARVKVQVGKTRVLLDGERTSCRRGECNLGNLVADAQVFHYMKFATGEAWTDVTMGIVHSGSIRLTISERHENGSITMEDILAIQPFGHAVDMIAIKGKHLKDVFEYSVEGFDPEYFDPSGKFLQVSGIRIVFDISKPNGQRVKRIQTLCQDCRIPKYVPLEEEKIYKVTVPGFLVNGGSGYDVLKKHQIEHFTAGIMDADVLIEYFKAKNPVIQGIEGRIRFETDDDIKSKCIEANVGLQPLQPQMGTLPVMAPQHKPTLSTGVLEVIRKTTTTDPPTSTASSVVPIPYKLLNLSEPTNSTNSNSSISSEEDKSTEE